MDIWGSDYILNGKFHLEFNNKYNSMKIMLSVILCMVIIILCIIAYLVSTDHELIIEQSNEILRILKNEKIY